jgi:hypothetical protein
VAGPHRPRIDEALLAAPDGWPEDIGTLQYEIYFNDDQSECIVLELYKDSEALIQNAANLGDLMEAILATGSVSGELLGEPSADLRAELADGPVRFFMPFRSM